MVCLLQAKMLRVQAGGEGGLGVPNFFLQISFSCVIMSFHVKFHIPWLPGSALKVFVVGGLLQAKRLRVQAGDGGWGGGMIFSLKSFV